MGKIIRDVVNFPNGCETVRFTACFVSMLMRAEGIASAEDYDMYCGKQGGPCIRCGECGDTVPLGKMHEELYNLYTAVTGFGFLQIDLSSDEHMRTDWNQTCNVLLRELDWYIGFAMDYAGYEFEELIFGQDDKARAFEMIKASIDRDVPVLALFGRLYQWVLVTGYDDDGALLGYDGSRGYWGAPVPAPAGYTEDGLFIMPDWFEKGGHAFILGERKPRTLTLRDVMQHGIRIMQRMQERKYFDNSVDFMMNDVNFDGLDDEALLQMRDRIGGWIGQPIDMRPMLGNAMGPLQRSAERPQEVLALEDARRLCWTSHDVLWIAWRAVGEFMPGDKLDWARGLQNKVIRRAVADCVAIVRDHDRYMLAALEKGFGD